MTSRLPFCLAVLALVACKDKDAPKNDAPAASASASGPSIVSTTTPPIVSAPPIDGAPLVLSWKAVNAPEEHVSVSLVAGEETLTLGKLNAASDDAPGTVATCAMKNPTPFISQFWCGATPAYNFYTASIKDGALVVTLTTGIDGEPSSEKVSEVARKTTTAPSLRASGPAPKGLWGNCKPGSVQRTASGPCMRQCLKGTECKGEGKCTMIAVAGTDGPHNVHACVPAGK